MNIICLNKSITYALLNALPSSYTHARAHARAPKHALVMLAFCLFALLFDSIIFYERENRLFAAFFLCVVISFVFHFHIRHWYPLYSIRGTFGCIASHCIAFKIVEHWILFPVLFVKLKYMIVGTLYTQSLYVHIWMNTKEEKDE